MTEERTEKQLLSVRERRILMLLAEGRTARQAADDIGISMQAVQNELLLARSKLGATTVHLVALALSLGEIDLWPPRRECE